MRTENKRGVVPQRKKDETSSLERFETSLYKKRERGRKVVRAERQDIVAGLEEFLPEEYVFG